MITIDSKLVDAAAMYKILIGTIVPRPIAFVSTMSPEGKGNLAPFSFYNGVSSNPPCLVVSVSRKPNGEKKDTLRNIEATQEFVVNSSNEWFIDKLVHSAAEFPYGVDEMERVGLTPLRSERVRPSRVAEAAVQFECIVEKLVEIGDGGAGSTTLVIGRIILAHVKEEVYRDGKILIENLKPIARLGGTSYCKIADIYQKAVPKP